MLISKYIVQDGMLRMKNIIKSNGFDKEKQTTLLKEISRDVLISIEQNADFFDSHQMGRCIQLIKDLRNVIIEGTLEQQDFLDYIDEIKNQVDAAMGYPNGNRYDFKVDVRRDIDCSAGLDIDTYRAILGKTDFPHRDITILDPITQHACLRDLCKDSPVNMKRYYITVNEGYVKEHTLDATSVALGRGSKANISNNVFDMMFIKPSVTWSLEDSMLRKIVSLKSERSAFASNMKYVREGGIVTMVLPYGKVTNDMLELFCRHLQDIRIFRLANDLQNPMKYVIIMGTRRPLTLKGLDQPQYEHLVNTYVDYYSIERISRHEDKLYTLPGHALTIENFRGSIVSEDSVLAVLEKSKLTNSLLDQKMVEDNKIEDVSPPLPFNTGQIGLVLTSGCLDGVIEEGCDYYHVIKGRVIKSTHTERESVDDQTYDETETISNKVEISVMLANGEYRILA